ncbi:MAG: hypothetical protein ABSC90_04815 [Acidimicrobiales bacterium]
MISSEQRYRRWLRFYPKEYRQDRGEEILATLLEASAEHGRLSTADLLHITAHGAWVRSRLMARCLTSGKLPRSVYIATVFMVILAVLNLTNAALSQNGPKNQSSHVDNIVVGFVFVGLALCVRTWSRRLYPAVMVALVLLVATAFVTIDLFIDVYAVIPLALLVLGRRRYMAVIPEVDLPEGPRRVD